MRGPPCGSSDSSTDQGSQSTLSQRLRVARRCMITASVFVGFSKLCTVFPIPAEVYTAIIAVAFRSTNKPMAQKVISIRPESLKPGARAPRYDGGQLADTLGRPMRALRISVTDRCHFRCGYCMPRGV